MRRWMYGLWALLVFGLMGCASSDVVTTPDMTDRDAVVATPVPPTWQVPAVVVTRDNAAQLANLGRLDSPIPDSGSFFAHAFSLDGTRLAALNRDYIVAWDLLTGDVLFYSSRQDAQSIFFSPDKTRVYSLDGVGVLRTYDTDTGQQTTTLPIHADYSGRVDYDPVNGYLAAAGTDGSVRVWDVVAREVLVALDTQSADVTDLVFVPDAETIVLTTEAGTIQVWAWRNRELVHELGMESPQLLSRVAVAGDGRMVAVAADEDVRIWDITTGDMVHILNTGRGGTDDVLTYDVSGRYVLNSGTTESLTVWDMESGTLATALQELGGEPTAIAFSPDGQLMVSSVFQRGVNLWDFGTIDTGLLARAPLNVTGNTIDVGWSPDGRTIALFDTESYIHIWGIANDTTPQS